MSGHIFKTKCEPILSEIAIQVQRQIINELQLATPNIIAIPIGSVGKRPYDQYNGDIDIAIKCNTIEELESIIRNTFYYLDVITIESLYIVSIAFPYKTLDNDNIKYVQCDFMIMWNEDYTKFRYYCPNYINNESNYKVGAKIMFANMIINHSPERFINLLEGQTAKFDFRPTALYKIIYDFNTLTYKEEYITDDVDKIVRMCFSDGNRNHFNSVETLWEAIHSDVFRNPSHVKDIEKNWFINCWRKGWTSIKPEHFNLQYWKNEEIYKYINETNIVNKINQIFQNGREI